MCGLVGIISKTKSGFFQTDKSIFQQMIISDMFRGLDSTGMFAVNKHGNVDMIKDACAATSFLVKSDTKDFMGGFISNHRILIGHNRKATMGTVVAENAHPFIEGNHVLVHNGTLTNHKNLADTLVDSHAIVHHINEHGYKSMFKTIEGAYALIWYSADEKTLYFCRNAERPLHLVETDTKIYLASEGKMLDWILDRNGISKYQVQPVPTDKVFKFDLDSGKLTAEHKPKKESSQRSAQGNVVVKWPAQQHLPNNHNQTYGNPTWQTSSASTTGNQASIESYTSGDLIDIKVVDFDVTERSTKLICETLDGLQTCAIIWLSHEFWKESEINSYIDSKKLKGRIASVTSKRGVVSIYLSAVREQDVWLARYDVEVTPEELSNAGGTCYCCSTSLNSEKEIRYAEVTRNKQGHITYMLCETCADSEMNGLNMFKGY